MTSNHSTDNQATPVTIYGRTYNLKGAGDPEYLAELAQIVDGKMREIAESTGTADTLKLAILASLNIADESLKSGSGAPSTTSREANRRLARMVTMLDEALAG